MTPQDSVVGLFESHASAENAVKLLRLGGVNLQRLSIVGRDEHSEERVIGFYNTGERMQYWGTSGAVWGAIWGVLFGAGFFWVPGLGQLLVAGPLVAMIAAGLDNALLLGSIGVLGAGLYSIGIPKDSILQYETAIKTGHFVLVVHGSHDETQLAREILQAANPVHVVVHRPPTLVAV